MAAIMSTSSYRAEAGTIQGRLDMAKYITMPKGELAGRELLPADLFTGALKKDTEVVDWAVAWIAEGELVQESYVNLIPTAQHGTHVNGLRTGFTEALREYHVALERGEVQVTTIAYSTLVSLHPDWLRDKKVNIIAGLDFTDVPGVTKIRDMIADPQKKAMWDFVALGSEFGTSFLAASDVPDERLRILRQAFDATMRSDELIADARKRALDINPKSGEELDKLFAAAGSPTPETIKNVGRIMGVEN